MASGLGEPLARRGERRVTGIMKHKKVRKEGRSWEAWSKNAGRRCENINIKSN
jgi:hypothetical protein